MYKKYLSKSSLSGCSESLRVSSGSGFSSPADTACLHPSTKIKTPTNDMLAADMSTCNNRFNGFSLSTLMANVLFYEEYIIIYSLPVIFLTNRRPKYMPSDRIFSISLKNLYSFFSRQIDYKVSNWFFKIISFNYCHMVSTFILNNSPSPISLPIFNLFI